MVREGCNQHLLNPLCASGLALDPIHMRLWSFTSHHPPAHPLYQPVMISSLNYPFPESYSGSPDGLRRTGNSEAPIFCTLAHTPVIKRVQHASNIVQHASNI
jgi:hypothetical protein